MSKIFFKNDNFFCQLIPSPQKEVTEHHRALCYDNDLKIKLTFKLATITYINIALSILNQVHCACTLDKSSRQKKINDHEIKRKN